MSIPKEIELKLAVPEKVGARFRAHLETLPSTSHELSSNYFDTPTQRLQRYGLELRIRRDGNGFTQTMKRRLNGSPDFAREELECPLDAPSPRLDMLCRFLANKAWNRVEREGIAPVFSTCFHRVSTDRHVGNGRVELSLDTGTITAGTSALPISELEIELKSGAAGDFYEACEMLIDEWNLGLVIESKSDRGFRLLGGRPPEAFHGDKPRLNAGVTVDAALDVLLCGAFSHFLMNHPIVLAEAPEGVHQMRVGLRRLRSTLSTFKPAIAQDTLAPLLTEMRSLFKELGAVREADVFIMETLPEAKRKGLPADIALKLRRAVAIHRSKDFAILAKRLQGPAFARFVVGLGKWDRECRLAECRRYAPAAASRDADRRIPRPSPRQSLSKSPEASQAGDARDAR